MLRDDVIEAVPIVIATLDALLSWTPTKGRAGSELRTTAGDIKADVIALLREDAIVPPLIDCFNLARACGVTLAQMEEVRKVASAQTATLIGAIMSKDTLIELALAAQGQIIAATRFVSREEVDHVKAMINASMAAIEEEVADRMDSTIFQALINLHAAIMLHLFETARPLPRMTRFQFNQTQSTLKTAYRLYADAGRADELRRENNVVHPAFMPRTGRALSN